MASRCAGSSGGKPTVRTGSTAPATVPTCSPSIPRPRRSAARSTWVMPSATPTPTPWLATSACEARPSSIRSAGTTTGSPPSVACRTSTACVATRRSPTTPTSCRPRSPTSRTRCRSAGLTSLHCASSWWKRTRPPSRRCSAAWACPTTGTTCTPPSVMPVCARRNVCSCATSLAARRTGTRHRRSGTSTTAPRWRRPSCRIGR